MKIIAMTISVISLFMLAFNFQDPNMAAAWAVAFAGWTGLAMSKD
jgi:hypothetical protein